MSSNNSNGSSITASNQQPRQPPPGGNGHRKSSSLNRGWFEGTMEVISGMAPRPVTPSQSQTMRSASAPNSPARGLGGLFGGRSSPHHHVPIDRTNSGGSTGGGGFALPNFPIHRLPSQDSLDRSIHNESGHGKSTAQIIRDLKHSNSALSAKMASLEKRHMNELAQVEAASSSKRQELEQISAKQKMKLMQYEQYKAAAESKMKQQDSELSKVKEESAFQRHNISDLKNQLYQLQQEIDERDEDGNDDYQDDHDIRRPHSDDGHNLPLHPRYSRGSNGPDIAPSSSSMSTDDLQQMALDNEELVKEIQELQDQLMEYQGYDKKLKDLQRQLEATQKVSNGNDFGIPPRPTTPTRERPPLAPSKSRDQDEAVGASTIDQYRKQLQDTKQELETQTLKMYQQESDIRDLEAEKESLMEAHSQRVQELEERCASLEEESKEREMTLLASPSQQDIDQLEARLREEQNEQVVELEEQLEQYAEKLAEVAATLAESRQQAKNQEQYRKDEAEDLRMIQDAHEAEIARLEKELDDSTREMELRDEELEEVRQKYLLLLQQEKEDEKKFEERDSEASMKITKNNESTSATTVDELEMQLDRLRKEHIEIVEKLEMEKALLSDDLAKARDTDLGIEADNESPPLHRYWEEKTSKTKEVESLKNEIEELRQRVHESTESGRLAEQKVKNLERQLQKSVPKESEIDESPESIGQEEVIRKLKKEVEELSSLSAENESIKKELQEAQTALYNMDHDRQAIRDELNELVSSHEMERKLIQNESKENKEKDMTELQNMRSIVKPLEAEKLRLQDELQKMKEYYSNRDSGTSLNVAPSATVEEAEKVEKNLKRQIEDLNEEKSLIKAKLKDRDTTIATLLRSSIVLENQIDSLQAEVDESRAKYEKVIGEFHELKDNQQSQSDEYSKAGDEIEYLKGQIRTAKADAKRWKRALKEDGTTSGEYRYQISMLQKANADHADTIQERDQAIQNLVNQSMGQESHVRDLKIRISSLMKEVESVRMNKGRKAEDALRAEIDRLQEESEIFAGQIIEQDEEFKRMQRVLFKREEQIGRMKAEIEGYNRKNDLHENSIIKNRDRHITELEKKIDALENQRLRNTDVVDPTEVKNLRAELDEMQEAAESNRVEIRDLRQQLWEAKDAAGSAGDLRVQLDQARWEFNEYKRNNSPEKLSNSSTNSVRSDSLENSENSEKNKDLENELRLKVVELEGAKQKIEESQSEMDRLRDLLRSKAEMMVTLLEEMKVSRDEISKMNQDEMIVSMTFEETDSSNDDEAVVLDFIKANTATIKSLRNKFQKLHDESTGLRLSLEKKASRIKELEEEAGVLRKDINVAKQNLQAKTKANDDLNEHLSANKIQLKEATDLKAKLGSDLADSQARLSALERELLNAITETSSNEDLSRKNQSLVQENASLVQKNESLLQKNTSLEKMNCNLVEESETLTKDNQVLCDELRVLGEQKASHDYEREALEQNIKSELDGLKEKVGNLAQLNDELANEKGFLLNRNKEFANIIEDMKEKNQILSKKGISMEESIESLKTEMENLSQEAAQLEELKTKLVEAETQREFIEKTMTEKYEEQMQLLTSSKDAEMDTLRNSLTESREKSSESMEEVLSQLKALEEENNSLKDHFELELQAKNQQIFALEHTLHAQEQIVETMRSEMDQIQSGMEHATKARRSEVEEMQQEVMQVEGKAMKQEREIVSLKMQLEERKLEHKADVVKLKDALAKAMEQDSPLKQTISDLQNNDRMLEVRERLEQLKARNTDLQEENLNLGGRLERAAIQISAFEVEKQQAEEIEEENMRLRSQLKEYEHLLSRTSKSGRNPPTYEASSTEKDIAIKGKDRKKKKFGIFKRKSVDESIVEGKEEEEEC